MRLILSLTTLILCLNNLIAQDYYLKNNSDIFYQIQGNDKIDEITYKIKKILKIS